MDPFSVFLGIITLAALIYIAKNLKIADVIFYVVVVVIVFAVFGKTRVFDFVHQLRTFIHLNVVIPFFQPEEIDSGETAQRSAPTSPGLAAVQLSQEYAANAVAADERYKGKRITISGVVSSVQKNEFNAIVILLEGQGPLRPVQCGLADTGVWGGKLKEAHTQHAATLKKGQQVVLTGKVLGTQWSSVLVIDCVFFDDAPARLSSIRPGQVVLSTASTPSEENHIVNPRGSINGSGHSQCR